MDVTSIQVGMFVATVALVAVSLGAFSVSYFLLRSSVDPHIIVYTKHDENQSTILKIVIENIGRGVAYDISFLIPEGLPSRAFGLEAGADKARGATTPMEVGPLVTGIPVLAPGERRVVTWGQYGGLINVLGEKSIRIIASFRSRHQFPWDPTDHVVESWLDVKSFEGTDASESIGSRQAKMLDRIGKELNAVGNAANKISGVLTRPEDERALERARQRRGLRSQAGADEPEERSDETSPGAATPVG